MNKTAINYIIIDITDLSVIQGRFDKIKKSIVIGIWLK